VEIAEAYDALSNSETRKIYDKYGHEGLKQHKQGGGARNQDPFDIFSRFFGGGGHFGGGGQRRGPDMEVQVKVPLKDFYNGAEHEISIEKQHICEDCDGSGSADGLVDQCSQCGGHGAVIRKHQLAPGIFQNVQMTCDRCGGKGKTIKHKCKVCGGSRVVRKISTHVLEIDKGMNSGARVIFENEADASPDWEAGNLIVHVEEKEPTLDESDDERVDGVFFRRRDQDLYWKEVLSLREAWMGDWTRNVTHLDGHVVRLGKQRGEAIQPGSVEVVNGEGMPLSNEAADASSELFGKLHVEYIVVLPDQMDKAMEKDFWALWEKWRKKDGVDLGKDSGRPVKDEL
jgi:DnaJ-related protein SCJ1